MKLSDGTDTVRVYTLHEPAARGFIAEEVALHLREITGRSTPSPRLVTERAPVRTPAVLLELDRSLGREGYDAEEKAGLVRIRGGDERGIYYGVLALFEALGCRWYAPGEFGTVIPRLREPSLPRGWHVAGKPFLPWRGYHICGTGRAKDGTPREHFDHETLLWMARNRMNFKPIHVSQYDGVAPLLRESLMEPLAFGHSYSEWVPRSDYESHPEFFPLVDGKRLREGQRCLSNPELRRAVVERIVAYVDLHPDLPIVSLAPNDGYAWCQCPGCVAMDSAQDRAKGELHRRNHLFAEAITRAVREKRPKALLSTISYSNYTEPGADVPREEGLAISMCITGAVNRGLDDAGSPWAGLYRGRIARWHAKAGTIFWSEYIQSYGGTFPRPYEQEALRTIRELGKQGVRGYKSEVVPGNFDVWRSASFLMYAVARGLYDGSSDADALLADFCRNFYGPGSDACLRYHLANRAAMQRFPDDLSVLAAQDVPRIWTAQDVEGLEKSVAEAAKAVAAGPAAYRERVGVLQRQVSELALTRREVEKTLAESGMLRAPRIGRAPEFADFDRLAWTEQRQRFNWLPYDPPSRFSVGWNDAALWVAFRLGENDAAKAREFANVRKGDVFHVSGVDTFFSPRPSTGVYYQLAVNVGGARHMARCLGRQWDSGYDLKPDLRIRMREGGWDLLVGIPWGSLETVRPSAGDRWKISLNRAQSSGGPGLMGGWPKGGAWHRIESMGDLIFEGTSLRNDPPKIKP